MSAKPLPETPHADPLSEGSPTSRRALTVILYLLIAGGCVLRVWEVFAHNPLNYLFSDAARHWGHAKGTLQSAPMVLFDPPLYQVWLSVVQKWTLAIPGLVAFAAAALSLLTPWLWYRALRELLVSRTLALAGWVLYAWLPSWVTIYGFFMSETLFLPLLGASLWLTLRAARKRTIGSFLGMTTLWLLASLARGIALPLGGIAGLVVWWRHPRKVSALVGALLIAAFTLGPLAWRNHQYTGLWSPFGNVWYSRIYAESGKKVIELHLSRDGAKWFYTFGSPSFFVKQFEPLTSWSPEREGTVVVTVDLRNGARDWRIASERTAESGFGKLRLRAENLLLVMAGQSWPDTDPATRLGRASSAIRWLWFPALLVVLAWTAWRWREALSRPLLPLLVLAWLAVQGLSLFAPNEGRYRKPIEGLLVAQLLLIVDSSRRRRATGAASPGSPAIPACR
jgi:4-amino-4-deoxy-L-arabinose transferase-like glycosyltransferase